MKKISLLVLILIFYSCYFPDKAGNLSMLGYPIDTKIRLKVIRQYVDSLIEKKGYKVPEKWLFETKLVDLDSVNNKRIYFKNNPEEMYLISFNGMLLLADVYDGNKWLADKNKVSLVEERRLKERLQHEILDTIESMAKRDGLVDSIIYK